MKADGYTGAFVASVIVHGDPDVGEHDWNLMAKVVPEADKDEVKSHRKALVDAPAGFAGRLVRLQLEPVLVPGGKVIFFQDLAGGTTKFRPASLLTPDAEATDLVGVVTAVAEAVATSWNDQVVVDPTTVDEFLRTEVRHLSSGTGALRRNAGDLLGTAATSPWVRATEKDPVAPNPFLSDDGHPALARQPMDVLVGRSHGDLHPGNIMVLRDRVGVHWHTFRLIDLRTYAARAPRGRDQSMLLLSGVARLWPTLAEHQLEGLLGDICEPHQPLYPRQDPAVVTLVSGVFEATDAVAYPLGFRDAWYREYLLCVAATSVRFTTFDSTPVALRWWFTRLAARALRRYCDEAKIPIGESGPPARSPADASAEKPGVVAPPGAERATVDRRLDGFVLGRLNQERPWPGR